MSNYKTKERYEDIKTLRSKIKRTEKIVQTWMNRLISFRNQEKDLVLKHQKLKEQARKAKKRK